MQALLPEGYMDASEQFLLKIGSWGALVGGFLNLVGNAVHPATLPSASGQDRLREIATNPLWLPSHVMILTGVIAMLVGFVGLYTLLKREGGQTKALAQIGMVFALLGSAVSCVLLSIDGFVMKQVALIWHNSAAAEQVVNFRVASGLEHVDLDMFSVFLLIYFGVTFIFFGWAAETSRKFMKYLGWTAVVFGVIAVGVGVFQLLQDLTNISVLLFILAWSVQALWMMIMGWRMRGEAVSSKP